MPSGSASVVVVSHACVLASNRDVYEALATLGEDVELVVPSRWHNEYRPGGFAPDAPGAIEGHLHLARVVGAARPQRHVYLARCASTLRRLGARVVLIEEEPFSLAAVQWSRAARRAGVPYGVQVAETLDREMPAVAVRWRRAVLAHAALVVARSPAAAELARRWGARVDADVVPHDVAAADALAAPTGPFTVAYVGRLVEEKGLGDLLGAVGSLSDVRLVVAGAGPMADAVTRAGSHVEYLGAVSHERIGEVYARAHVTCVPSRSTRTWEEQFGRVVVESLARGVPVVAASTGELPWVLSVTGGSLLVAERDPDALGAALASLRDDPGSARALGLAGRDAVRATFTTHVVAGQLAELLERVSPR